MEILLSVVRSVEGLRGTCQVVDLGFEFQTYIIGCCWASMNLNAALPLKKGGRSFDTRYEPGLGWKDFQGSRLRFNRPMDTS
jgi:hypothetical protein